MELYQKQRTTFWTYIDKDIDELESLFIKIFSLENNDHDCENVWEWLEGDSTTFNCFINIRRVHDGDGTKGDYKHPLIINLFSDNELSIYTIEEIGKILHENLHSNIFQGTIWPDKLEQNYDIEILREFK